jgi:hypothetical protein
MVGSLGAGAHAHACPREDAGGASGYRSSLEHRARAPISEPRTEPQPHHGDPLPDPVSCRHDYPLSGDRTSRHPEVVLADDVVAVETCCSRVPGDRRGDAGPGTSVPIRPSGVDDGALSGKWNCLGPAYHQMRSRCCHNYRGTASQLGIKRVVYVNGLCLMKRTRDQRRGDTLL